MNKIPQAMTEAEYNSHLDEIFKGLDFEKLTRQERRKASVEYQGRTMPVYKFFKVMTAQLPPCVDREGVPYDHEQMLRKWYKDAGLLGVKEYVSIVRGAARVALGYGKEDDTNGFVRGDSPKEEDKLQEEGGQQREGVRQSTAPLDRG
jgi:hypothetical protein